jgi:hypothetical protein
MVEPKITTVDTAPKKRRESFLVLLFSAVVIGIIGLALWVSIDSVWEKIRISEGLQQIISIVAMARDAARSDPQFATGDRKDLLNALERSGRIQTDGVLDGIKMLKNPWGNPMVAVVNTDGNVRVETIVPPHICQRFIGSFGQNPRSFGIKQVEVKGSYSSWRQVYNGSVGSGISEANISAGCGDTIQADAALIFSLR